MKLYGLTLFILISLFSLLCSCDRTVQKVSTEKVTSKKIQTGDTVQSTGVTEKNLHGQWLNRKYYDELFKTKSAREAQRAAEITYLEFKNKRCLVVFNLHEGLTVPYSVIDGSKIVIDLYSRKLTLSAFIKSGNTVLKSKNDEFIGYSVKDEVRENVAVNRIVFSGIYINKSTGREVVFRQDGRIEGLKEFTRYRAVDDYLDAGLNLDMIKLKNGDAEKEERMTWEYNNNRLYFYKIKCAETDNGTCIKNIKDGLVYTFIKQGD